MEVQNEMGLNDHGKQNRYIALDLELEQPNDEKRGIVSHLNKEKIIQVGWVVFDREPFYPNDFNEKVLVKRKININIEVPLSDFIKKLTGISNKDIENGTTLKKAYQKLASDQNQYQTSRIIREWGGGDISKLKSELIVNLSVGESLDWEFGRSGFNVKHFFQEYAYMMGWNHRCGLSKAVGRMGLLWQGRGKHQADVDALNTAFIYSRLYDCFKKGLQQSTTPA